ncbi:MAG: type II secretion system GspH family protein, partial [Lachnospira sp.]|nr:type II secretion system GspH family protein [Lachnospira sp.]
KKSQKRLGNKGFSLVELIVVIAIMAVLVGVLAPTLIRNVEKSRESTDMQTLDSIRGSITTALSVEKINNALPSGGTTFKYSDIAAADSTGTKFVDMLKKEMEDDGTSNASFKSSSATKDGHTVMVSITSTGAVEVYVNASDKTSTADKSVVTATRLGSSMTTAQ